MATYEQFTDVCTFIHHHDHDRVASIAACHKGAGSGARYESMMYAVCAEERESASAPVVWKANFASSITPKTFQTLVLRVVPKDQFEPGIPLSKAALNRAVFFLSKQERYKGISQQQLLILLKLELCSLLVGVANVMERPGADDDDLTWQQMEGIEVASVQAAGDAETGMFTNNAFAANGRQDTVPGTPAVDNDEPTQKKRKKINPAVYTSGKELREQANTGKTENTAVVPGEQYMNKFTNLIQQDMAFKVSERAEDKQEKKLQKLQEMGVAMVRILEKKESFKKDGRDELESLTIVDRISTGLKMIPATTFNNYVKDVREASKVQNAKNTSSVTTEDEGEGGAAGSASNGER
ncbi:hypothetical protein B484DRAFT_420636 [Ochromonadaceae sp. CCMP2298]|nr:hypothetical protein B484DRAFT_420636 [Ochromonadaceae sp. CCMP2298]